MGFNSAFKGLKFVKKTRERAFKQFKWPRPQCVNELEEDVLKVRGRTAKTESVVLCGCNARIGNSQTCHTCGTVLIGQEQW